MPDLLAVMLVCASTVPQPSCDRTTAVDVMVSPASTPFDCAMRGQAMVAGGALAESLKDGMYLKIQCERSKRTAMEAMGSSERDGAAGQGSE
jgi:hypothetical protein